MTEYEKHENSQEFMGCHSSNLAIMTNTIDGKTKIKVMKDGKSWEVDESELDKLPKDIREKVKAAMKNRAKFPRGKFGDLFQRQNRQNSKDNDFQKRFHDLNRQIDELQKAIEKLKKRKQRKKSSKDLV